MINISVIIPIYGVEKYIERCARSLFEQTMADGIEFIFVNDCTPDKSIEILEKVLDNYPNRKSQTIIIHNEQNGGLAAARLAGLKKAQGKYIIHCDSDDYVDVSIYEKLYNKAIETNADIVVCDFCVYYKKKHLHKKQIIKCQKEDFIKQLFCNELHNSTCNKLIKSDLYHKVSPMYIPGLNMLEDKLAITRLAYFADTIVHVPEPLYHYIRTNGNSYTFKWKSTYSDTILTVINTIADFYENKNIDVSPVYTQELFLILVFTNRKERDIYRKLLFEKIPVGQIDYSQFDTKLKKVYAYLLFNEYDYLFDLLRKIVYTQNKIRGTKY